MSFFVICENDLDRSQRALVAVLAKLLEANSSQVQLPFKELHG